MPQNALADIEHYIEALTLLGVEPRARKERQHLYALMRGNMRRITALEEVTIGATEQAELEGRCYLPDGVVAVVDACSQVVLVRPDMTERRGISPTDPVLFLVGSQGECEGAQVEAVTVGVHCGAIVGELRGTMVLGTVTRIDGVLRVLRPDEYNVEEGLGLAKEMDTHVCVALIELDKALSARN